ncbi:hypothetical protein EJB05_32303, partial [Eragrostis curvula]
MGTIRVAGASEYLAITGWGVDDVKLAKKAWVWLGQRCKTLDAAPASYEVEAHAATSDKFAVVFRAVYTTVGLNPKVDAGGSGDKGNEDTLLLLHGATADNKLAAPRHRRSSTKKLVNGVVEARVRALAATMTTEQICVKGSTSFAKEVLESARLDLAKYGLRVYNAADERLAVNMPANKVSLAVVDEDTRAAPTTTRTGFSMQVNFGENAGMVEATFPEKPGDALVVGAATKKKAGGCDDKQSSTTAVDVGVHVQMEVEGMNDVLLRLTKKFKQPEQFAGKAAAAAAAVASDGAKVEESKYGGKKAAAEYLANKMKEIVGDLRAIKEDVTKDKVAKMKAIAERLLANSDMLDKLRLRPTEARKAEDDLLDELLAKAEHAAADLQTLAGKIRAFKVHMKVESANMQRLEDEEKDSNKVDLAAMEATLENETTVMKELAGDVRALMDNVAMDIKDAAEVAEPITGSLDAVAEAAKAYTEVISWYLN